MRACAADPRLMAAVKGDLRVSTRPIMKALGRRRVPMRPPTGAEVESERPFWGPHPDPEIAFIEDEFYRVGFNFLSGLLGAAIGKAAPRTLQKAGFHLPAEQVDGWGSIAKLFDTKQEPQHLMDGWASVINKLTDALLPKTSIESAAKNLALRSHLLWKAGQRVSGGLGHQLPGWLETLDTSDAAKSASLQWTKIRAAEHMTALNDEARHSLLMALVASKEAKEKSGKLQQRLFDSFSQMNRDWRRIALTETALAASNGQLVSLDMDQKWVAEWVASPKACPFCKKMNGQKFQVVSPDAPKKDGDTQVWAGKHNVGRSAHKWSQKEKRFRTKDEMWWPVIPAHPNCACAWVTRRVK